MRQILHLNLPSFLLDPMLAICTPRITLFSYISQLFSFWLQGHGSQLDLSNRTKWIENASQITILRLESPAAID